MTYILLIMNQGDDMDYTQLGSSAIIFSIIYGLVKVVERLAKKGVSKGDDFSMILTEHANEDKIAFGKMNNNINQLHEEQREMRQDFKQLSNSINQLIISQAQLYEKIGNLVEKIK